MEDKKDLWCPTCKEYPDDIRDIYDYAIEKRTWIDNCYELQDVDYGNCHEECAKCGSTLEHKSQEEDNGVNPLPEVSGEVSHKEDISNEANEGAQTLGDE